MQLFFAVRARCALDLASPHPAVPRNADLLLGNHGFEQVRVDMTAAARACAGVSRYRRGARLAEAPGVLDCSSFVKWLYGLRGIWLPRRSIQQYGCGDPVSFDELREGDLLFWSGPIDYYIDDPECGIGHVGYCTGDGAMIHAVNTKRGVVEVPLERYMRAHAFRGARRIIPNPETTVTFAIPQDHEIESSDDLKWTALQLAQRAHRNAA